jgi:NAD(P)-dependent dehydrogenase (short-subunit alcohol dehydrogenase family)
MTMKAIVTGHSKGLGEGIAAALLAQGIAVLGVARGPATRLAAQYPALLTESAADFSDSAALSAWLAGSSVHDFVQGAATILLVNNAGTVRPVGPLADQDPMDVLRAVTLNVAAPLALAAAVVEVRGDAVCKILHISSGAGRSAYPGWSVYCATKAALDRHAEAVLQDGDAGVRCVSLAPGVIDTGMQEEIRGSTAEQFPMLERFIAMKEEGTLQSAEATGADIVKFLLADGYGDVPVSDIRR